MRLRQLWPGHPLWVVAEPAFFQELMPLAPDAVFFPPSHCKTLALGSYAAAINLSSAPQAARTMAALKAPLKLGPVADATSLHIEGFWQLYRAALTLNNHSNAFHWADLHLLDLSPVPNLAAVGHAQSATQQATALDKKGQKSSSRNAGQNSADQDAKNKSSCRASSCR